MIVRVLKKHFKELYENNSKGYTELKISCEDLKNFMSKDYEVPNGKILLKQKSNASAYEKDNGLLIKIFLNIIHLILVILIAMLLLMELNPLVK